MSVTTERAVRDDLVATEPDPGDETRRPRRGRSLLAAALVAVIVVGAGLLAWMSVSDRSGADGGLTLPDEREQAMSLTSQFVKRLGTYSPDMLDQSGQMPDYRDQVREVITPKFAADFDKEVGTAEQLVAQGGITRSAEVFATAVSSIDEDSAQVLVAGAFTDSYTQGTGTKAKTIDQEPLPFRFVADLVKIDGTWLVDDFTPVSSAGEGDGAGAGSGAGTTEGSTP
jgi:Mce-associated membrane protein